MNRCSLMNIKGAVAFAAALFVRIESWIPKNSAKIEKIQIDDISKITTFKKKNAKRINA